MRLKSRIRRRRAAVLMVDTERRPGCGREAEEPEREGLAEPKPAGEEEAATREALGCAGKVLTLIVGAVIIDAHGLLYCITVHVGTD